MVECHSDKWQEEDHDSRRRNQAALCPKSRLVRSMEMVDTISWVVLDNDCIKTIWIITKGLIENNGMVMGSERFEEFVQILDELSSWVWMFNALIFENCPLLCKSSFWSHFVNGLIANLVTAHDG